MCESDITGPKQYAGATLNPNLHSIYLFLPQRFFLPHYFSVLIASFLKLWLRIPLLKTDDDDSVDVNSNNMVSSPLHLHLNITFGRFLFYSFINPM